MKISIIGLGAYSIAIAQKLSQKKCTITMWTESQEKYEEWRNTKNVTSIIDTKLSSSIKITTSIKDAIEDADIIYLITASRYVDSVCKQLSSYYNPKIPICIASKGIEESQEKLLSEIVAKELKTKHIAVISGPTFAIDMINNEPIALALGSKSLKAKRMVIKSLSSDTLKLRPTKDLVGIELCGSIKNVIAIASGILNGLGFSESTQAFLINESLHDIKDMIYYFGGKPKTILSFAGVGDLMLTCMSKKSRNFSFGYVIGSTKDPKKIQKYLTQNTVEGYFTLNTIHRMLKQKNIEIELIDTIYNIVYNNVDPSTLAQMLVTKK